MFLVDGREDYGVGWHILGKFSEVLLPVISNLSSKSLGELGGGDERKDVRVVGESEDLFVGGSFVVGCRADSNDLAGLDVGELQFEGESVPVVSSAVSELELLGVFVEIVNAQDLGNNVEVLTGFLYS